MIFTERYRPKTFEDFIGNEDSILTLKNLLKKKESCPHTFLFIGDHGVGKTSLAKILSYELGAIETDILEINSSNNRGIDTARELIEVSNCDPQFLHRKVRIFILDEVHKSTGDFQNAMLKTLENPPSFSYFMLCTTNPEKIISTIRSRCTIIKLDKVENVTVFEYLKKICIIEKKKVSETVLKKITKKSEGHMRDALKLLEKILDIKNEEKQIQIVNKTIISDDSELVINLCRALLKNNNWEEVRKIIKKIEEEPEGIRRAVLGYMSAVILNAEYTDNSDIALMIIKIFKNNYIDTGKAGLISNCYERYRK